MWRRESWCLRPCRAWRPGDPPQIRHDKARRCPLAEDPDREAGRLRTDGTAGHRSGGTPRCPQDCPSAPPVRPAIPSSAPTTRPGACGMMASPSSAASTPRSRRTACVSSCAATSRSSSALPAPSRECASQPNAALPSRRVGYSSFPPLPSDPDASPRDRRFVATRSSRPWPTKYSSPTSHPAAGRS